jgi:hypothetical protein
MHQRPRAKTIPGYRVQPKLPTNVILDGHCEDADFTEYDGQACVEALVHIGLIKGPYTLVLSIEQAIEAGFIEKV